MPNEDVSLEHLTSDDPAVDVPLRVDADALRSRMLRRGRFQVLDERGDRPVLRAADADAFLDPGQLVRAGVGAGFRVGDVDRVVARDRDAARPPELPPFVEERAALIEDLNAVVLAVADEEPAA